MGLTYQNAVAVIFVEVRSMTCSSFRLPNFVSVSVSPPSPTLVRSCATRNNSLWLCLRIWDLIHFVWEVYVLRGDHYLVIESDDTCFDGLVWSMGNPFIILMCIVQAMYVPSCVPPRRWVIFGFIVLFCFTFSILTIIIGRFICLNDLMTFTNCIIFV